jgi:uncharacterized membrane protein YGL010W
MSAWPAVGYDSSGGGFCRDYSGKPAACEPRRYSERDRMPTIDEWFARYGAAHRNAVNEAVHWICVPAITWSVIALAWWLSPYAALALCALTLAFYAYLSLPIAFAMLGVVAAAVAICLALPGNVALIAATVFVVAWIGQFAGHKVEGAKPAFLDDLKFLLIGPAWLAAHGLRALHIRY